MAMTSVLQRVLPAICLACLTCTARAAERAAPIRDEAGLFRADTVVQAEQQIDYIRRTYGRNLFVFTVSSASPDKWKWFRKWFRRPGEAHRILEEEAQKLANESSADGIYVVIRNDPGDVQVVVRPADDPAFTPQDAETLRRTVARRPRNSDADEALLALVRQVQSILQAHATRGQSTAVVNEFVLASVLGGVVGLWLLLCLIRFKMRARHAGDPMEQSAEERARRGPALLGAMFGFPAGHWLYDKLYPSPAQSAGPLPAPEPLVMVEREDAESSPVDERAEDAPVAP
jgi:hypothetical protein